MISRIVNQNCFDGSSNLARILCVATARFGPESSRFVFIGFVTTFPGVLISPTGTLSATFIAAALDVEKLRCGGHIRRLAPSANSLVVDDALISSIAFFSFPVRHSP